MAIRPKGGATGPAYYGKMPATGIEGEQQWSNAPSGWTDDGAAQSELGQHLETFEAKFHGLMEELQAGATQGMEQLIARQVKDAVSEYVGTIQFALAVHDGQVCIFAEIGDEAAQIKAYVPFGEVLAGAMAQAANDKEFSGALLNTLEAIASKPQPAPAARPRRMPQPMASGIPAAPTSAASQGAFGAVVPPRGPKS